MNTDRLCPTNCKYIDSGKCIATECNRKLGEYENDAKGSQRRPAGNIKESTMHSNVIEGDRRAQ